ncbi:MAG: NAD(P)H-dependent oxidoreductase [Verrucomicrobiota bacterium]|nr:NAD(P)H-dependent oxidoreductase [Verrucomicrobiota bacterium]
MPDGPCKVLLVVGSLHEDSVTRVAINHLSENLSTAGCEVNTLDFIEDPLPLFNPDTVWEQDYYSLLKKRVLDSDVIVLGTPDYHGSISSTLKNFLDHFWKEFAGKLFATVVASHEKGLTVHDQLRTVARQCYAWAMPYGVSFLEKVDVKDGQVVSEELKNRLEMLQNDIQTYGSILSAQRSADLAGTNPGFMAQLRK